MDDNPKCLECGGMELKPGQLMGYFFPTASAFIPKGGSKRSYNTQSLLTKNTICLDCGFVEISCDPEAAKVLVKNIEAGKERR